MSKTWVQEASMPWIHLDSTSNNLHVHFVPSEFNRTLQKYLSIVEWALPGLGRCIQRNYIERKCRRHMQQSAFSWRNKDKCLSQLWEGPLPLPPECSLRHLPLLQQGALLFAISEDLWLLPVLQRATRTCNINVAEQCWRRFTEDIIRKDWQHIHQPWHLVSQVTIASIRSLNIRK